MKTQVETAISEHNKELMLSALETHIEKTYVQYKTALRRYHDGFRDYLYPSRPDDAELKNLRKEVRELIQLHRAIELRHCSRAGARDWRIKYRSESALSCQHERRRWHCAIRTRLQNHPNLREVQHSIAA
ncbi:MAG: hypothetical protein ABS95_02500 [Verrucomicrobia bacterium SCN 57-15]|nr:MAG: hypothetical protein ABS95_02500 [Verrucomicrobia bacterium SCN 57-15]